MCSWCYAFGPVLKQLRVSLPADMGFARLLGGLAPDTDAPMPAAMQQTLQATWKHIEDSVPGTRFNHDFWTLNQPRRSTWPACRAVIAARNLNPDCEEAMIEAIQHAYYCKARNPSNHDILIDLADEVGLPRKAFSGLLDARSTRQILADEISQTQTMGVRSFPSLVLNDAGSHWPIAVDYRSSDSIIKQIGVILDE